MEKHIVEYNGITYPTRFINAPKNGGVVVASTDLEDALVVGGLHVGNKVAELIDEGIFFYLSAEEMLLSDVELAKLIDESI